MKPKPDTCLVWGPTDGGLPALLAFRDRLTRYLDHARAKSDSVVYARMIPVLQAELISTSQRIVQRQRREKVSA